MAAPLRPLALVAVALYGCAATGGQEQARRPNIVWIVADDLGYADCGFTGSGEIPTPRLDELAAGGVVLTDAHVTASVCAPSRAGLVTGRYQQRFGFECNVGQGADGSGLPADAPTIARALRAAGYETAAVGKWHLGADAEHHPLEQGFEHFTGLLGGSRSYEPITAKEPPAVRRIERDGAVVPETELGYLTDFFSAEAVRFVEREDRERPLFLYLSYTAPHTPMQGREDLMERLAAIPDRGRRTYAAMVAALDEGVGRVVDALAARGELDDTLILFLSDNGGATNNASDNGSWRGMKGSKWEGGHRVPMIVHWPRALGPDRPDRPNRYGGLSSSLDLYPTSLAAAGVPLDPELDGVDLLPHLTGRDRGDARPPHDRLFWRRAVVAAARRDTWKLIRVTEPDGSLRAPVLVDLAADPDERTDLAGERADLVAELTELLEQWERTLVEPRWTEGANWERNQRHKHRMDVVGRDLERQLP